MSPFPRKLSFVDSALEKASSVAFSLALLVAAGSGCDEPAAGKPATITFTLRNLTDATVYYPEDCVVPFQITSAATGAVVGVNDPYCGYCDCAEPTCEGQAFCGACAAPRGVPLPPGATATLTWIAQTNKTSTKAGSRGNFACLMHEAVPTGGYVFGLSYAAVADDANRADRSTPLTQTFTLTHADATVDVPIR